jgi:AbrB family looped-hinge helix DNA binding protein
MCEATVGANGRITIPADVRLNLSLQTGDRVLFTKTEGEYRISKIKGRSVNEERIEESQGTSRSHDRLAE